MTKITVKLYTLLREKTGKNIVEVEADTIAGTIKKLKKEFAQKFILGQSYIFVLNEEIISKKDFKTKKLKTGDILHIFPPIAGGRLDVWLYR
ncbi:MAG TPA: molybdopterin synthase sulfur carrier subunit [Elusimicrobia bacterium]|jgi:MoaD family protein|nr:molybdopterin synthase sulfur carrier subunit [Elusimicrobiota bacterium]